MRCQVIKVNFFMNYNVNYEYYTQWNPLQRLVANVHTNPMTNAMLSVPDVNRCKKAPCATVMGPNSVKYAVRIMIC